MPAAGHGVVDAAYLLRRAARSYADVIAIDDGARSVTMAQLVDRAERLGGALQKLGIERGHAVGILADNCTAYVEVDIAIALSRRVRVPLNARQNLDDFRYVAGDADLRALFYGSRFADVAERLADEYGLVPIALEPSADAEVDIEQLIAGTPVPSVITATSAEDVAWITYTSGTTGRPKGVVLSHRAVREVAVNVLLELGPVQPGSQLVLAQPLSHGAGYFVLPYLMCGGSVFVQRKFDAEEIVALSKRPSARLLKIVPAMLPPLLELDTSGWGFDTIMYGASPIPGPLLEQSLERFGPSLVQIYGQTEAPITLTCLGKSDHKVDDERRRSAGRPWHSVAVDVVDPEGRSAPIGEIGEVVVRGSHMMTGYHNLPDQTADVLVDGWVRTRDMGKVDEQGFVYLLGRSDEMINSGGFNISPREVEAVVARHAAIREVVVVGLPDERWGDKVTAIVCAEPDMPVEPQEIIDFCRPLLGYRAPRSIFVRDAIPYTPFGKVDRVKLMASLQAGADA